MSSITFSGLPFVPSIGGKEALKESLKKVVIKNEAGNYYGSTAYAFSGGVLTIDHQPFSNIDNITERSEELSKLLMKNL